MYLVSWPRNTKPPLKPLHSSTIALCLCLWMHFSNSERHPKDHDLIIHHWLSGEALLQNPNVFILKVYRYLGVISLFVTKQPRNFIIFFICLYKITSDVYCRKFHNFFIKFNEILRRVYFTAFLFVSVYLFKNNVQPTITFFFVNMFWCYPWEWTIWLVVITAHYHRDSYIDLFVRKDSRVIGSTHYSYHPLHGVNSFEIRWVYLPGNYG